MDDTQQSRASDAAATRKRRSSILKSQRPARTPFSELEFNVATPTDTAKSRRVSFSKRTGVAEFVTNEATTTWKNFYEEHNKSLESSGNDSDANQHQPVLHLGKRIFDQQFEEVEAIDFMGTLNPTININNSMSNFTEQIASLERTDDGKLTAPLHKLEFSNLTDHQSKLFGNDFTVTGIGEMSGRIDVNFSAIQQIGMRDDLDDIQRDLERVSNVVCQGPSDRHNISEYIEVDLNMTSAKDDCDMSITDTIHSPKVQDVSRSTSIDKKQTLNNWATDKENIAINPYAPPCEDNFAVNDEPNQVLIFDGKRLTLHTEKPEKDKDFRQTLLPNSSVETPQRKTIVLNTNDDLPNFAEDLNSKSVIEIRQETSDNLPNFADNMSRKSELIPIVTDDLKPQSEDMISTKYDIDLSMTVPVNAASILPKRKTINDNGNMSITQALYANIITGGTDKRRTIVYDNDAGNVSMTQALPSKIITENSKPKDRTVVYENDTCNISITQSLPTNILQNNQEKRKTIVFDEDNGNISITQAFSSNVILEKVPEKRKTIVFDNDNGNVSITQALPANIVLDGPCQDNCRTVIYEDETGNISVKQESSSNMNLRSNSDNMPERRRTILYEDDTGNISVTQAIPQNIILGMAQSDEKTQIFDAANISMTQVLPTNIILKDTDTNKRRTIVYEDDTGNISITQAVPSQLIEGIRETASIIEIPTKISSNDLEKTGICDQDVDISTEAMDIEENNSNVGEIDNLIEKQNEVETDTQGIESKKSILNALLDMSGSADDIDKNIMVKVDSIKQIENKVDDTLFYIRSDEDFGVQTEKVESKTQVPLPIEYKTTDAVDMIEMKLAELQTARRENSSTKSIEDKQEKRGRKSLPAVTESKRKSLPVMKSIENKKDSLNKTLPAQKFENRGSRMSGLNNSMKNTDSNNQSIEIPKRKSRSPQKDNKNVSPVRQENITTSDLNVDEKIVLKTSPIHTEIQERKSFIQNQENPMKIDDSIPELPEPVQPIPAIIEESIEKDTSISENVKLNEQSTFDIIDKVVKSPLRCLEVPLESTKKDFIEIIDDSPRSEMKKHMQVNTDLDNERNTTFKDANNTKELLDMISDFTDKTRMEDEGVPSLIVKRHVSGETKTDTIEPKRLSFAPKRQSILISREDLLNNISMAQAALQKSRLEYDDSSLTEDTQDTSPEETSVMKKSGRLSNEVVKTLHFDDESISELSLQCDSKESPLKKTAFGETAYMKDSKAKVIPTYLKDVSDGIKELMSDLVKPMADTLPFETCVERHLKRTASTASTQIQANLITSSQIDLDVELSSNPESAYDMGKNTYGYQPHSILKISAEPIKHYPEETTEKTLDYIQPQIVRPCNENVPVVLVFDHENPLNNILLGPLDCSRAHKYNPSGDESNSAESLCGSQHSQSLQTSIDTKPNDDIKNVTMQYNVEARFTNAMQGDVQQSLKTVPISKPVSTDKGVSVRLSEVKDIEVNTLIAMKGNKELLETSSSLTLVDETESKTSQESDMCQKSPMRVIFNMKEESFKKEETGKLSTDTSKEELDSSKGKKRIYKPATPNKNTSLTVEVTPKPNTKMQKISDSPNLSVQCTKTKVREVEIKENRMVIDHVDTSKPHKKSPRKSREKSATTVTVQQLITEYQIDAGLNENILDKQILEALKLPKYKTVKSDSSTEPTSPSEILDTNSLEIMSSFTSSKNLNEIEATNSTKSVSSKHSQSTVQSLASKVDWQADVCPVARNLVESDSGVNIVAKIDMLPFMGTPECEWESSSSDTWCFRLLHGRLRLSVRLAHRHDNATRTHVKADTPVTDVTVETLQQDKKNPEAFLCVRFACETLRYLVSRGRGTRRARDVPALLRRGAAVARVALRWGRAMHDAKLHLAYTLDTDGHLTLKVANLPLRSVWEVSLQIALVVEDAREAPWPRAGDVRVLRVLSDVRVPDTELRHVLQHTPKDWGHAPRTLWRIFKYLKHKTRDDDLLLGA
ncbi:uncharacterized protein LOC142985225 [Anticarsia gemmatalis]|uniref:uncharacterized protein LOC142985225 n=1 Tax=Anticarsia gemmatalis TaxID=129554 RepID=UPI003F765C7A